MILEFYLFVVLVLILVIGNILFKLLGIRRNQLAFNAAMLLLICAGDLLLMGAGGVYVNLISINAFSTFFILLFTLGVLFVNLLAYERSRDYASFALLGSFALVGMYLVAFANSLILIFLGLELTTIPSTFVILLSKRDSTEAATKFFIMASIAIALLSFAIVLVYGSANSLNLQSDQQTSLLSFAFVLFLASLGFEASIVPFNVLLPDVYQGAGAYATAMLGGVNKKVGLAALLQVLILIFITSKFAFVITAAFSVITMFYGNMVALVQDNFKRMLAYSSISQTGYILIGISVHSVDGVGASLFQIFAHMFLFIGAMSVVAWLESKERNEINDLIGLYRENRFAAVSLTIFLVSLVGIPLTTGFMGKFLLFLSAVNSGLVWLAILGIVNSIISIFYYIRAISAIYTNKVGAHVMQLDRFTRWVILGCVLITLIFGIYPQPIIQLANSAAGYLLG